jgi:hypothetical protein
VTDDKLMAELVSASRNLCQVIENGLLTGIIDIQDGYEDMLTGPVGVVRMITETMPGGGYQWSGELRENEVQVEWVATIGDDIHNSPATGVRLTHRPTGIVREANSSGDKERNRASAWRSLEAALAKRYARPGV